MEKKYILVTGGPHKDVGKGCVAATIGRILAIAGKKKVTYQKLEGCVQEELGDYKNPIIESYDVDGVVVDADIERALFWIPGFFVRKDTGMSLSRLRIEYAQRVTENGLTSASLGCCGKTMWNFLTAFNGDQEIVVVEV
jgi:hypothetical protein